MNKIKNAWKNFWYRRKTKKAHRKSFWDEFLDALEIPFD